MNRIPLYVVSVLSPVLLFAQTTVGVGGAGIRESREIRYPTSFDVSENDIERVPNNNQNQPQVVIPPVVVPEGFTTRSTGQALESSSINVSGRIIYQKSANGQQLVTLRANNGQQFNVATGMKFKMGSRVFQAMGFEEGRYRVQDLTTKKLYYFAPAVSR